MAERVGLPTRAVSVVTATLAGAVPTTAVLTAGVAVRPEAIEGLRSDDLKQLAVALFIGVSK